MVWKSCRLLWLSLSVGCAVGAIFQSSRMEDPSLFQARLTGRTERLSVECVLNEMEQEQGPSLTGACDYHFALCVSGDIVYFIMDESPSDMFLLEPFAPGSTVLIELEDVHIADYAECMMLSMWNNIGSPVYRVISANAVSVFSLSEVPPSIKKRLATTAPTMSPSTAARTVAPTIRSPRTTAPMTAAPTSAPRLRAPRTTAPTTVVPTNATPSDAAPTAMTEPPTTSAPRTKPPTKTKMPHPSTSD